MSSFNDELNRILKYESDQNDLSHMLQVFAGPEHNQTRWGGEQADHTVRNQLSDALRENGRHVEADLVADPQQHVLVHEGRIRPAKFNHKPISAANKFVDHLENNHDCDVCFGMGWEPDDVENTGKCLVGGEMADSGCDMSPVHISEFGDRFETALRKGLEERGQTDILNDPAVVARLNKIKTAPYEEVDAQHPSEQNTVS